MHAPIDVHMHPPYTNIMNTHASNATFRDPRRHLVKIHPARYFRGWK
jgi:hypothetical protein